MYWKVTGFYIQNAIARITQHFLEKFVDNINLIMGGRAKKGTTSFPTLVQQKHFLTNLVMGIPRNTVGSRLLEQ
jgi:hypothetical protein